MPTQRQSVSSRLSVLAVGLRVKMDTAPVEIGHVVADGACWTVVSAGGPAAYGLAAGLRDP